MAWHLRAGVWGGGWVGEELHCLPVRSPCSVLTAAKAVGFYMQPFRSCLLKAPGCR